MKPIIWQSLYKGEMTEDSHIFHLVVMKKDKCLLVKLIRIFVALFLSVTIADCCACDRSLSLGFSL